MTAFDWSDLFDGPDVWTGGLCSRHGCFYEEGCEGCPPAGHPLYEGIRLRREWALRRNRNAA